MPRKKTSAVPAPVAVPAHPSQPVSEGSSSPFPSVLAPLGAANGTSSPLPNGTIIVDDADAPGGKTTKMMGGFIPPHIVKQMETEGIDQFELPRAVVTRVAKSELPDNVQIRKEAVLAISKSATIFISYLAAVSDELAKQNTRKTVSVSDVIEGLGLMEFPEDIRAEVKANLKVFRQLEADKKAAAGSKSAGGAADASTADAGDDDEEDPADDDEQQDESERQVQSATTAAGGEEQPVARPADEKDVDEEDEDTEQKMVGEGAQDGEEEDGGGGGDDQDEDMDS